MSFASFGLSEPLLRALEAEGCRAPFPVQVRALPPALEGRDVRVVAETGSGKTVAFALPILQRLARRAPAGTALALVLVPTRELAVQVGGVIGRLGRFLPEPPRVRIVHGGVSINPQMMALRGGAEVVVATPGRLLDLVRRNAVRLAQVEVLVLDEADRMLDLGFREELDALLELLPDRRQNLLFSATSDPSGAGLARTLRNPAILEDPGPQAPPQTVKQRIYLVDAEGKGPLLRNLLRIGDWSQVLVFVASHRRADTVVRKLRNNAVQAEALHGDLSQGARTEALESFRAGTLRVLVATDLASRGLDLERLPCVINYELPRSPNDYVHRVGRTGRAGGEGLALSLVSPGEAAHMALIEKRMGIRIPRLEAADMDLR